MGSTRRQRLTLILLGAGVLAVVLLAAGVGRVTFPAGVPFTLGGAQQFTPPPMGAPAELSPLARFLLRAWFILTLALLPFSIYYLIISPEARRRVFRNLLVFGIFVLIMSAFGQQLRLFGENGLFGSGNLLGLLPAADPAQVVEFSGAAPGWLTILLSLGVAAFLVALVGGVLFLLPRVRRSAEPAVSLEPLAEEAEAGLVAILQGGDVRDAVTRCYIEMSRVARERRGLRRQPATTAREFEEELLRGGLPAGSVRDLTRLFEAVRYGAKELGPEGEARALACLSAIAAACRKSAPIRV